MVRSHAPLRQVPTCEGKIPIDVAAPLPFATALVDLRARRRARNDLRASPRGPPRTIDRSAHRHVSVGVHDPPDLRVDCRRVPVLATRLSSRVSSHGVVQRSPLHRTSRGVRRPVELRQRLRSVRSPFGREVPFPSAIRPRGFPPPRRLAPPRPCDPVSDRCRSWGSPRFSPSRNGSPRDAPTALRSLPSADSVVDERRRISVRHGTRHLADRRRPVRSPRPLPPRPFRFLADTRFPASG
jgi:hypothetical protein